MLYWSSGKAGGFLNTQYYLQRGEIPFALHTRTFFFWGWDDNLFRIFFIFIYFCQYIYIYIFFFFLRILYLFMYYLISQFQSIHYSNLHFIISNSHYNFFVSSAVSVESSPLETVSVPLLSLTSLKFTKWLVFMGRLYTRGTRENRGRRRIDWLNSGYYMYTQDLLYLGELCATYIRLLLITHQG